VATGPLHVARRGPELELALEHSPAAGSALLGAASFCEASSQLLSRFLAQHPGGRKGRCYYLEGKDEEIKAQQVKIIRPR